MITQPSLAIISFSPIARDARVLRQAQYLAPHYDTTVIAFGQRPQELHPEARMYQLTAPKGFAPVRKLRTLTLLPLGRVLPALAYEHWYWQRPDRTLALEAALEIQPELIHANDWDALPIAVRVAHETGARVLLDLHEYSPRQFENRAYRRLFFNPMVDFLLKRYGPSADVVVTVNHSIAGRYAQEYGFRPHVVMNAPSLEGAPPFTATDEEDVHLIHHGVASRDRKLEMMVHALSQTQPRYSLSFMLVGEDRRYINSLRSLSEELAPGRVSFLPPVPPGRIVTHIGQFDLGFVLLPPTSFSYYVALPNKFFDFVMAGLGVILGPSPEMSSLASEYGFGAVAPSFDPSDIAQILNDLSAEDIDSMKHKALQARKYLNADAEMSKLLTLYSDLANGANPERRR